MGISRGIRRGLKKQHRPQYTCRPGNYLLQMMPKHSAASDYLCRITFNGKRSSREHYPEGLSLISCHPTSYYPIFASLNCYQASLIPQIGEPLATWNSVFQNTTEASAKKEPTSTCMYYCFSIIFIGHWLGLL